MAEGATKWARDFFDKVEPILIEEPLGSFLGALSEKEKLVFKYADAVKLAGHSCPAVAGAYKITALALKALYGEEAPVRGEVEVEISGKPTDLAYGPMSQVISYITGAWGATGFKGLKGQFARADKLLFDEDNFQFNTFTFKRTGTGKTVRIRYTPDAVPFDPRMGELMPKALAGAATDAEKSLFAELWQDKVKKILLEGHKYKGLFEVEEVAG